MTNEYSRDVKLGPDDLFGAALLCPAFTSDLSIWRLNIHRDGTLTQTVQKSQPPDYTHEQITYQRNLDPNTVARLLALMNEIEFSKLRDDYACAWTDQPSTTLKVRIGDLIKTVAAYGPHAAAYDGDADMKKFVRLWDSIVELSPFVPFSD